MTIYRTYNTYACLTTVLVLVLSALACSLPVPTTPVKVVTTPAKTVVKPPTTPQKRDNSLTTVTADSLHVRTEPMGLRIGYLYHGDSVTLTNRCSKGWAQIVWQDATAWVNSKYLSDNKCQQ